MHLQGLKTFLTLDNIFTVRQNSVLIDHFKNIKNTDIFKMMSYNNFAYFIFKKLYKYNKDPTEYNLFIIKKYFILLICL